MKSLLSALRGYRRDSVLAPLLKAMEALMDLLVPLVMAQIIDTGVANGDTGFVLRRCAVLAALALAGLLMSVSAQYFASRAATGCATALRRDLFRHIQTLDFASTEPLGAGTLLTRMTSNINQVQSGLNLFLRLFMRSPFVVLGSVVLAFVVDGKSAWIFVVAVPLLAVAVFAVMLLTMPLYKKVQGRLDRVTGLTRENLTGVRVVRAFNKEEVETARFTEANEQLTRLQLRVGRISALMNPVTTLLINIGVAALLWLGARQVNGGVLLQGSVIALVSYMNQILVELVKLANLMIQVTKALACAGRVEAVLTIKPGMRFPDRLMGAAGDESEAVRFAHVGMTYAGAGGESLTDIDFVARAGQTVGVVGGTGSGKSTLISLIPRFYDATEGRVSLFGRDVRDYPREELARLVAVTPQKAQLFSGTIRSNLLWGDEHATDDELWAALETAQAADFVRQKPLGLDEKVEQGGRNLSGGQRQRLTIARALLKKARILILDDSASALDLATDAALRRAIAQLPMTVFLISQRTASLRGADRILVLEEGRLVGSGTHEELLKTCEVYREIHDSQFRKGGEA